MGRFAVSGHVPGTSICTSPGDGSPTPGEFLGSYQDLGDRPEDEPDVGTVIYLGFTPYQVVHLTYDDTTTGGVVIVEPEKR